MTASIMSLTKGQIAFVALLLLTISCKQRNPNTIKNPEVTMEETKKTVEGIIFPNIEALDLLSNNTFDLSDHRGKFVLVDFWGTWCVPCVEEMPKVKQYAEKYKNNLVVVGINSSDTYERMKDFVGSRGYDWIQLKDEQEAFKFSEKFEVTGFPTKLLIDPKGVLIMRYTGAEPKEGQLNVFEVLDRELK